MEGKTTPLSVTIADWGSPPNGDGTTAAFSTPYRYTTTGVKPLITTLGDYTLRLDTGKKLTGLTLPNDKSIKVVAISLEK